MLFLAPKAGLELRRIYAWFRGGEEHLAYLLTGHTALGLWAEVRDDVPGAIRYYRATLGSYRDTRIEDDLALARVKHLRQASALSQPLEGPKKKIKTWSQTAKAMPGVNVGKRQEGSVYAIGYDAYF